MTDNSLRALGRGCPLVSHHSAPLSLVQLPPDCVLIGSDHGVADARSLKTHLKVYKRPQNIISCLSLCLQKSCQYEGPETVDSDAVLDSKDLDLPSLPKKMVHLQS